MRHAQLVAAILTSAAIIAICMVACVTGNTTRAKGIGTDQTSNPANNADIHAGGNVWNLSYQRVEQNAGAATTALAAIGWFIANRGRWRERRAAERTWDCTEDCDACKAKVRKLRDPYINKRVLRRFHRERVA